HTEHHDVALEPRELAQRLRDGETTLLVGHEVAGGGEPDPGGLPVPCALSCALSNPLRQHLELPLAVDGQAAVQHPGEHGPAAEWLSVLDREDDAPLGIERVLKLAEKPQGHCLSRSPRSRPDRPPFGPCALPLCVQGTI